MQASQQRMLENCQLCTAAMNCDGTRAEPTLVRPGRRCTLGALELSHAPTCQILSPHSHYKPGRINQGTLLLLLSPPSHIIGKTEGGGEVVKCSKVQGTFTMHRHLLEVWLHKGKGPARHDAHSAE